MTSILEKLKIAQALEDLVAKGIADIEFGMDTLNLPTSVRAPMWEAVCRRAMVKVVNCERAV